MLGHDVFGLLIAQTWQVAVVAVLAWIAVRILATDRPHLAHAIWALVLIKCMVPPVMSSPISPFSWIEARSSQTRSSQTQLSQTQLSQTQSSQTQLAAKFPMTAVEANHMQAPQRVAVPAVATVPKQSENQAIKTNAFKPLLSSQLKDPNDLANSPALPEYDLISRTDAVSGLPTSALVTQRSWSVIVVWCWLVGAAIGLAVISIRFAVFLVWLNKGPAVEASKVEACVETLRQRLGIRNSVRVKVSARPVGPAVIGVIRPMILLPISMVENKTDAEIEPLIAHELIHVRRGDLWWAMLQTVATSLFWFHPLVWIASRMLTRESERCCDEETIAGLGCQPADYARGLLQVLERKHQLRVAPALPGVRPVEITSARLERVMRLGNGIQKRTPLWAWLVMLFGGAVVLPGAAWAVAQEQATSETQNESVFSGKEALAAAEPQQDDVYLEHRFEVGDLLDKIRATKKVNRSAESILISELPRFKISAGPRKFVDSDMVYFSSEEVAYSVEPIRGVRVDGDHLIVNETSEHIKQIQKGLDNQRELGFDQMMVETRFLRINQEHIQTLGIDWEPVKSDPSASVISSTDFDPTGKQPKFNIPPLELPQRDGIHAVSHIDRGTPVLFSVASEIDLQRIIKMSPRDKRMSLTHCARVTVFNGQDAEVASVVQRPFVTAVKEVLSADGKDKAHQPIISLFGVGMRMRIRPILKGDTIEIDCHAQLNEISDVKVMHLSQSRDKSEPVIHELDKTEGAAAVIDNTKGSGEKIVPPTVMLAEGGTTGVSIQSPTVIATNVEVKRSIPLGDTLLLEMLSDESDPKTDTLIVMLTCRKISPKWAKESEAEKKQATDRATAIAAAEKLPAPVKEEKVDHDVVSVKAGDGEKVDDAKPRVIEVMGQKFRLEGDIKFEVKNSGVKISGKQLSVSSGGGDIIGSCEGDGSIESNFDEAGDVVSHKMHLTGGARVQLAETIHYAADDIKFSADDKWFKVTLEGNARFQDPIFTGLADRLTFDDTGIITLSGRASLFRSVDGKLNTGVRGEKILISVPDEIGGEPKITVDPDEVSNDAQESK